MKKGATFALIVILFFSLFSYPLSMAGMNKAKPLAGAGIKIPEPNPSGKTPEVGVGALYYTFINSTHMRINASIENSGSDSGPFSVTFRVINASLKPPEPREVPFGWVNVSGELSKAIPVHSGDYVRNGSAVLRADDGYIVYKLPFTLNFFGRNITNISVSTNGYIELLGKWEWPELGGDYGVHMDRDYEMSDIIFALDDDLETEDGYLLVVDFSDKVVVEWFGSTYEDWDSSSNPLNFQVVLFKNGTVRWSYRLLNYSSYSYDLFTGYYSKVTRETLGFEKAPGKSFELFLPSIQPSVHRVPVNGLPSGEESNVSLSLPLGNYYVKVIADDEEVLNDTYRGNNIAELSIWPGDYRVENASIENVIVGDYAIISYNVTTTSLHPTGAVLELLRNGKVESRYYLSGEDFVNGTASGSFSWRVQGGDYNLSLAVSSPDDTDSSDNFYSLGHYSLPLPNFRIANYSVALPPCLGAPAEIRANVTNEGNANWSGVRVIASVLYSDGSNVTYWTSIGDIPAGETREAVMRPIPKAGNVTGVFIAVDPDNLVDESNESDNSLTVPLSRVYENPDFTVGSIDVPVNLSTGNTYHVNATIENLGGCYAGSVRVDLYENGYYESYAYTTVNGSTQVSLRWTPSSVGEVNLTVSVDPYNSIPELNESNNRLSTTVLVNGPDIVITNVKLLSFDGIAGSYATFNVTVKNLGEGFTRGFYVKAFSGLSYDYAYVSGGLASGEEKTMTLSLPINGGNTSIVFTADCYDDIAETNESNNRFTYGMSVPLPNFVVESVELPNNTVGHIPINVTVKNIGAPYNGSSYPVRVRVFLVDRSGYFSINQFIPTNGTYTYSFEHFYVQAPGGELNVTVNYLHTVNESDFSDNSLVENYTTGYPDLRVDISVPAEIKAGQNVQVNLTVLNTGNATLKVENVYWWTYELGLKVNLTDERGGVISRSYELAPVILPPDGNVTRTAYLPFNGGLNTLRARVDYGDKWVESNETNNEAEVTVNVEKPDLFIASYSVPREVLNGTANLYQRYPIKVNVSNAGGDLAGGFYVGLLDNGSYQDSAWISFLSSGEVKEITLYYTPKPGEHNVTIAVDYHDYWIEANESNNNATFKVSFGRPDFAVLNFSIPEEVLNGSAYLYQGYPVKVNVTNLGANFGGYLSVYLYDNGSRTASTSVYGLKSGEVKGATLYYYPSPGRHNLTVRLDPYNNYPESNEDNNEVFLGNVSFGKPELAPLGVTWEPYNFTSGERVTFKTYVRNSGQAFCRSFSVRFEIWNRSTRLTYGYGSPYPYSWCFSENETKEFRWTWYNAEPGNLTVKVMVDYYNYIPETNESNNEYTAYLGSIGTPDFAFENLSVGNLAYGKPVDVNVTLRNLGEAIYRPFSVLFNISGELRYLTVYGLGANESKTLNFRWYVNKVGNVTVTVKADPNDQIIESNEDNNEISGSYYIEAPDLTISSYRLIEDDLANGYVTFKLNVTNLGGDDYAGFYVGGYVDNETHPRATAFIGSIMKGETKEMLLRWKIQSFGRHNVSLRVDVYNAVPESNETNNEIRTSYYIEEPDLSVEGVAVEGDLIAGNLVTFHVTVKNLGGSYNGPLNVLVYAEGQLFRNYTTNLLLGENTSRIIHVGGVRLLSGDHNYTVRIETGMKEKSLLNNERVILLSTPVPDLTIEILNGVDEIGVGKNKIDLRIVSHNAPARNVPIKLVVRQGNETKEYTVSYSYWKTGWDLEKDEVYERSVEVELKPGDYEITAIIDPDNIIGETDETNNRNSLSGFLEAPDLEITGFRVLGQPYIGAKIYFLFNITNHGGLVRDVPIKYEILRNGKVLSIAEKTHGTITVVEANSWREYDFDNTNLYAGNLTIRAWIDPGNLIPESNESNNYFEINITIDPVDLQITGIELPKIEGYGWYSGNITVRNSGPNAVSSPYRLRISARIIIEAEGKNLTAVPGWVEQIMPGQDVKIPFRFKVDSPLIRRIKVQLIPILCLGSFCLPFPPSFMDNFDFKPENNALSRELNMTVPAPDLVIVNYTYSPSNPTERDPLNFNVTVRNVGDGPSLKSEIGLTFGGKEAYLGYGASIPPLQPGETYTLHFTATRAQGSIYGLYNGNLSLRIKSNFIEKNETNNVVNFYVPIKLIPILTVDTRLIRLDRKLVISRPSIITVPLINHGHVGANVTITSEFATFPEFSIAPMSSKYVKGTVLVPENRTDLVGSRIPIVMNLSAPYNNFTFIYSTNLYSGAEPEDLVPKDKDIVNRVLIYWRTELPSNGILYYRAVGKENWTRMNMGEGYVHTALLTLDYKKWYEYYVVSWNRFGNHTSELRRFYTFRSLGFEKAEYHFTVKRDYNQFREINVLNPLNETRSAEAVIESTYPDIAVGFVGRESWTAKELFPAHSNITLSLGLHLQDARQWNYTLLASLQDDRGIKDYAIIRVEVEPVVFNITYRVVDENPYTLTKTVELVNHGGNITDFYLRHSDKVVLSPELLHYNFREGQRILVNVTPVLTRNFTSHTETLVMTGANQEANFTLEFKVPAGKSVFRITPNLTIEFFYPDDSVFTNPKGTVPSYLYNGTPYFFGKVYVRVMAYGHPLPSMNVTLTLRNSTAEVSDSAVTDILGIATFSIVARGGEEYSYIVTLGENVTTGWKSFYVNATPIKSVMPGAVNLSALDALGDNGTVLIDPPYIFTATFPNISRLYTNDTLAVLRIRRYSFPAAEWVSVGTFDGERFTFNVTNLAMGLYEARVFVENGLFYATSKPFVFLAAPSNFTPVPRRAIYAFRQDINGSVVVLTTEVNSTSTDKMVFIYSVTPYNSTHSNLTLLVYTSKNITDVLNLTMFDGNNRTIYHISRPYNFTAPLTVITLIVPSNASGYLLTLEDPFSMSGAWRAVKRTGGKVVSGAKNLIVEGGRTLYLMAKDGILTPHTKSGVIVLCAAEMIPVFGNGLALAELGSDALSAILNRNTGAMGVVGLKKGTGDIKDYAEGIVKDSAQGYDELFDYAKRIAAARGNPEKIAEIMREIDRLQITDPEKFRRLRKALAYYNELLPSAKVVKTGREATEIILEPGILEARGLIRMGNREFTNYLKWFVMREAKNMPKTLLDEAKATKLTRLAKIAKGGAKLIPIISIGATLYSNYENWKRVVKEGGGWFTPAVTFNIQATASSRTSGALWCLNQKDISGVVEPTFDNPTVGYLIRKNLDRDIVRRAIKRAVVLLKVREAENAPLHDLYLLLNGREIFGLEGVPAINREFMIPVDPSLIFPVSENELTVLAPLYNPGIYSLATGMELEYLVDLSKLPLPLDDLVSMYLIGTNLSDVLNYLSILESKIYTSDGAIMHVIRSSEKGTEWSPMFFLVELGNKGNAEAWTGVVVLYANGTEVDAVPIGRLDPLESDYALLVWVPNETGKYDIEIKYDYLYGSPTEDRDYSNNVYRTTVEVLPAVPDLTIRNVSYSGVPGNVTVHGILDNLGGLNVEEAELAVYVNGTLEWLSNVSLGPFNVSLPLNVGVYSITLAVDPRNLVNESNETNNVYSFTAEIRELDTTSPVIIINSPASGVYNVSRIDLNVTVRDESGVSRVYVEFGNTTSDLIRVPETDFWVGTVVLPDRNTTLTVGAIDTFGNAANASIWVLIDTKVPRISILSPLNETYNDRNITFNYTIEEENLKFVRTYLDGAEVPIASGGSMELDFGTHEFRVVAGDIAGHVSEENVLFRINEPPEVDFTWSATYLMVHFVANASDPDGISRYLWDFGDGETAEGPNPVHTYARGGVYNVTLTVWDSYNLSARVTKIIEVFTNVSLVRNESYAFSRDFGFYNTTEWEPFREDFENWTADVLSTINVSTAGFDEVLNVTVYNWVLSSLEENLTAGSPIGWINATYTRTAVIRGLIGYNMTTLLLLQTVHLHGNATHIADNTPPAIRVIYPENRTYDTNITEIIANVTDDSGVLWVKGRIDETEFNLSPSDGVWKADVLISDGRHNITLWASDIYGNVGFASLIFTVNTSVRIVEGNNTTVMEIPGDIKSDVKIGNKTVRVTLEVEGFRGTLTLPKRPLIKLDGRIRKRPWLFAGSSSKMKVINEENSSIMEGSEVYIREKITLNVTVSKGGYAVIMVPLRGMRVSHITVKKNGSVYELSEKESKYGYFRIIGGYLCIFVSDDPVVEVRLETVDREKTEELRRGFWMTLGLIWEHHYMKLREELPENITSEKAMKFYRMAEEYLKKAEIYLERGDYARYAIYARKAYICIKRVLEILKSVH